MDCTNWTVEWETVLKLHHSPELVSNFLISKQWNCTTFCKRININEYISMIVLHKVQTQTKLIKTEKN